MQTRSRPGRHGLGSRLMSLVGVGLLCLAVFTGYALAQSEPPGPEPQDGADATPPTGAEEKPKATPEAEPPAEPEATPPAEPPSTPEAERRRDLTRQRDHISNVRPRATRRPRAEVRGKDTDKTGTSGKVDRQRRRPPTRKQKPKPRFEMDPNAKWVCDEPTVSVDSVWRGDKKLTFNFHIRNEGTADLRMKARGG